MSDRFSNEDASEPEQPPRIVYPNDILSDENSFSNIDKVSQVAIVKALSSNPR